MLEWYRSCVISLVALFRDAGSTNFFVVLWFLTWRQNYVERTSIIHTHIHTPSTMYGGDHQTITIRWFPSRPILIPMHTAHTPLRTVISQNTSMESVKYTSTTAPFVCTCHWIININNHNRNKLKWTQKDVPISHRCWLFIFCYHSSKEQNDCNFVRHPYPYSRCIIMY